MPVKPVALQFKPGIQRDGTRFDADGCIDGLWVRFQRGKPRKILGYQSLTSQIPELPRTLHGYNDTGVNYVHVGQSSFVHRASVTASGLSGLVNRSPLVGFTASANNLWQFDTITDPFANNAATLIAHPGRNLTDIDNTVESALFFASMTGSDSLVPMSLPVDQTAISLFDITGTTTANSALVTGVSDTSRLRFGQTVVGTNIRNVSYITAVDTVAGTFTMSQTAGASGAISINVRVGGVSGGVFVLHPFVMAYDSRGRVIWSSSENPNDFWDGDNGAGEAFVTEQKIVKGMVARGGSGSSPSGLLWSLNALLRVYYVGGQDTFAFDTISDDITVLSPACIVEVDGTFMWAGTDRFLMYNGVVRELPNSENQNWFFDNLNFAQRMKAYAFKSTRWGEVWWCYPRGDATECTHAVIYNYRENVWYDTELPNSGRGCALTPVVYQYPILGGVAPDAITGQYKLWQHNVGTDEVDGAQTLAVRSYFETNDITLIGAPEAPDKAMQFALIEPDFLQTGDMTVSIHGNANARSVEQQLEAHTFPAVSTVPQEQVVPVKTTIRQGRLRFESNTAGGNYQMGKVIIHVGPGDGTHLGPVS